jgi:AbrB family looped-hinge helix DNA binding protein
MRLTEKGQVTVPIRIREQLGLHPGDEVEFVVDGDAVRLRRAAGSPTAGRRIVDRMRGRGDVRMSTDEIMALTRDRP